jgi:hypothetical protein
MAASDHRECDDPPTQALAFGHCVPARGPRRRPVVAVRVDRDLTWVAPAPTAPCGAARRSSRTALVHLQVRLAEEWAEACGQALDDALSQAELIDAAARVVADYLDDLPDLPFVGEPFGGEEGTD